MNDQAFSAILLNLDRDTARLEHMHTQLAAAAIRYQRQAGILGDAVPNDLRPFFYEPDGRAKTIMKRGEIGCYASHLKALTRVASGEYGPVVLIMEDDLEISPALKAIISRALSALPHGWDILRLSSPPRRAYAALTRVTSQTMLVRYSKIPNSAGAYLITPRGAQKFLALGVRGLTFDDDLRRPWFHHMDCYGLVPSPVKAGMLPSSIDRVEAGRFDKGMSSRTERLRRGDHRYAWRRLRYNVASLGLGGWMICTLTNAIDMVAKPLVGRSIIHAAARFFLRFSAHA